MDKHIFLSSLHGLQQLRKGWKARCPAHPDKNPSLAINEGDNGRLLIKCLSGCTAREVVNAMGLDLRALYPPQADTKQGGHRRGQQQISYRQRQLLEEELAHENWILEMVNHPYGGTPEDARAERYVDYCHTRTRAHIKTGADREQAAKAAIRQLEHLLYGRPL